MSQPSNYVVDLNPFHLAGPPAWWLRRLHEFDPSLVVLPSRQQFCYRLAQRRPLKLSEQIARDLMSTESDMKMMASHGCVPVTTILSTANWDNPLLFKELAERAPHRQGGAEAVVNRLEAAEAAKEAAIAREIDDRNTSLSKDSWKLYRKKIGLGRTWHSAAFEPRLS